MIKLKDLYPNQASFQKEAKDHEGKMAKSQLERSMEYSIDSREFLANSNMIVSIHWNKVKCLGYLLNPLFPFISISFGQV